MTKTVTTGKATDLITFTRSTTGTYLDSVKYGDELVTNGDFSNGGANWSVDNVDSTHYVVFENNSARFVADTSTPILTLRSDVVLEANETYKVEVNISSITSGSIKIDGASVSQLYNSVGTTVSFIKPSGGNNVIKFYRAQEGVDLVIDSVSVKKVISGQGTSGEPLLRTADTNEPRIEYDADGNLKGLLIEEQRTNEVRYSNSLSGSAWSGTNCTITTDSTTSPDGNINASKVTCSVDGGAASVWQFPIPSGLSGNYSTSIYLKADTLNYAQLNVGYLTTDFVANFDLVNGTVTNILGTGATITDVGNGWYRCTLPFNTLGSGGVSVTPIDSMSSTRRNGAVGSVFVYGAQLESGTFPTSYIPTSGSTVTRNFDMATINVSEFEYNTNEGSISMEIVPPSYNSGEQQYILGSNTTSARWAYSNAGSDRAIAYDGTNTFGGEDLQPSTINKIATGTDQSTGAIYVNGESTSGTTTTNGNIASLTTAFYLGGQFSANSNSLGGHIKSVKYYPVRLTDNQLKALTQ
jgi:hypothetical protein